MAESTPKRQDLRERIEAAISNASCKHIARDGDACSDCRTAAVLAVLVEPPGDLTHADDDALTDLAMEANDAIRCFPFADFDAGDVKLTDKDGDNAEWIWELAVKVTEATLRGLGVSPKQAAAVLLREDAARRIAAAEAERDEARAKADGAERIWESALNAAEAERDTLRAKVAEYENALNWQTSCLACSKVLDSSIADHDRAEAAERDLEDARINLTTAQGQLADERAHSKRAYEKIAALEGERDGLHETIAAADADRDRLEAQVAALQRDLAEAREKQR